MQLSKKMHDFIRLGAKEDARRVALGKLPMDKDEIRFVARGLGVLREMDQIGERIKSDQHGVKP